MAKTSKELLCLKLSQAGSCGAAAEEGALLLEGAAVGAAAVDMAMLSPDGLKEFGAGGAEEAEAGGLGGSAEVESARVDSEDQVDSAHGILPEGEGGFFQEGGLGEGGEELGEGAALLPYDHERGP